MFTKVSKSDIAWLAGIVDGEGSIMLPRLKAKTGQHLSRFAIANTDMAILEEVRRILDEWLVVYSISQTSQRNKACFQISVNRIKEVEFVLKKIQPYLRGIKKQKASLVSEFINNKHRSDGKRMNIMKKEVQYRLV